MNEQVQEKKSERKKRVVKATDVFDNVEYARVTKSKRQLEVLEGDSINGKSRTDVQKYLGNRYGPGMYTLSVKTFGKPTCTVHNLSGLVTDATQRHVEPMTQHDPRVDMLMDKVDQLAGTLGKNSGVDLSVLMAMKDESYKIQISFFKERIKQLDDENEKLRKQLSESDSEGGGSLAETLMMNLLPALLNKKGVVD